MSQCLPLARPDLDFCHTTGWPCSWGCCSKLSIGQSSNQQISACLFALLLLLLPSSLQRRKCRRRDDNAGYRASKARHQAWLALCLKTKPTLHDCNEPNNHPEGTNGNDFSDPCLFFCSLLRYLTYSSPWSGLLLQLIHDTEKCFWLWGVQGLLVWGFFVCCLLLFLLSFVLLLVCEKPRCKKSLENQTIDYIL